MSNLNVQLNQYQLDQIKYCIAFLYNNPLRWLINILNNLTVLLMHLKNKRQGKPSKPLYSSKAKKVLEDIQDCTLQEYNEFYAVSPLHFIVLWGFLGESKEGFSKANNLVYQGNLTALKFATDKQTFRLDVESLEAISARFDRVYDSTFPSAEDTCQAYAASENFNK